MDLDYWYSRVALAGINILFAWSAYASFMVGSISLGQAAFMVIGGYACASLTMILGWHIVPALIAAAIFTAVIGALVALPMLRLRGLYLTIATLAFAEVTRITLHNVRFGHEVTIAREGLADGFRRWIGPNGNLGFDHISWLGDHGISGASFALWVSVLVMAFGVLLFILDRSRLGYALRAVEQDEIAAQGIGLDDKLIRILAFLFGAALAALAGGLYAHLFTYVRPYDFGLSVAIVAVAYVVIGGGETFWGPALAAMILTFLPDVTNLAKGYQLTILGLFMILTTIYQPRGLVTRALVDKAATRLRRSA